MRYHDHGEDLRHLLCMMIWMVRIRRRLCWNCLQYALSISLILPCIFRTHQFFPALRVADSKSQPCHLTCGVVASRYRRPSCRKANKFAPQLVSFLFSFALSTCCHPDNPNFATTYVNAEPFFLCSIFIYPVFCPLDLATFGRVLDLPAESMVCDVCNDALEHRRNRIRYLEYFGGDFGHHRTVSSLEDSVDAKCWLCLIIWQNTPKADWDRMRFARNVTPLEGFTKINQDFITVFKIQYLNEDEPGVAKIEVQQYGLDSHNEKGPASLMSFQLFKDSGIGVI